MEKNVLHDIRLKMEFLLLCAMLVLSVSPAYAQRSRTIHGIVVDCIFRSIPVHISGV